MKSASDDAILNNKNKEDECTGSLAKLDTLAEKKQNGIAGLCYLNLICISLCAVLVVL